MLGGVEWREEGGVGGGGASTRQLIGPPTKPGESSCSWAPRRSAVWLLLPPTAVRSSETFGQHGTGSTRLTGVLTSAESCFPSSAVHSPHGTELGGSSGIPKRSRHRTTAKQSAAEEISVRGAPSLNLTLTRCQVRSTCGRLS